MGLISRFLCLFGSESGDPFDERLRAFVHKEAATADRPSGELKFSIREKMEAARLAVDAIIGRFIDYLERRVLSRHGDSFRVEIVPAAQATRIHEHFGEPATGNEQRIVRLSFQQSCSMFVKVEAIILSRSLEIKAVFVDHSGQAVDHRIELPLDQYGDIGQVDWDTLFEGLLTQFLDWREHPPTPDA